MGIEQFILQRVKDEVIEEEQAKNNFTFVKSLLTQTNFSKKKISQVADVPVSFVEEVKASLSKS